MSFNKIEQNCVIWFAVYAKDGVGTSVDFFYSFFHVTFESLSGLQSHAKVIPLINPLYETSVEFDVVENFNAFPKVKTL